MYNFGPGSPAIFHLDEIHHILVTKHTNNMVMPAGHMQSKSVLELVSKELNHLAAILHVYAGGLNFMK